MRWVIPQGACVGTVSAVFRKHRSYSGNLLSRSVLSNSPKTVPSQCISLKPKHYLSVLERPEQRDQIPNRTILTKLRFLFRIQLLQPLERHWIIIYPIKTERDTCE